MEQIPRIKAVAVIGTMQLLVHFDNGAQRVYDCQPPLCRPQFHSWKPRHFSGLSESTPADTGSRGMTTSILASTSCGQMGSRLLTNHFSRPSVG